MVFKTKADHIINNLRGNAHTNRAFQILLKKNFIEGFLPCAENLALRDILAVQTPSLKAVTLFQ